MKPIVIEFGGYQPPASIHNRAAARFGELLRQELGDRISFHLTGSVLDRGLNSGDLPGMVETGQLTCCYLSSVRFTRAVPEFKIMELPYLVREHASAHRAFGGTLGERLRRRVETATPFRVLGFWDNGFRHITNRMRPIRDPADCRGMRIRTQMSELHAEVFRALGFEPVPADIKLLLDEIGSSMFDAQDNPLTNIFNFGIHREHRHVTLTGHFFGATLMICSDRQFRTWPPAVRTAVEAAAAEATSLQWKLAAAEDARILATLDPRHSEVIHLSEEERAKFVDAVRPVVARHRAELGGQLFSELE